MPRVLAIRHCASTGQAPDAPLSEAGRVEARELADVLEREGVDRIVASPYRRARETIEPLAERLGLAVEIDDRLAERRIAPVPIHDWRERVARSFSDLDDRAPGGESGRDALARGWAALMDALEDASGSCVLVSHGQLLSLVLHRIDPQFGFAGWEAMTNPDAFRIERGSGGGLRFERLGLLALAHSSSSARTRRSNAARARALETRERSQSPPTFRSAKSPAASSWKCRNAEEPR